MGWTTAVFLGVSWLLGIVSSSTMGEFYLFLMFAVIVALIRVPRGRQVTSMKASARPRVLEGSMSPGTGGAGVGRLRRDIGGARCDR